MRILFATHHDLDVNSGAAGVGLELGRILEGWGHEPSMVSFDDLSSQLPWRVKTLAFPVLTAGRIARLARRCRVDVVDGSTGDLWIWGRISSRFQLPGAPALVTRSHGLEHPWHEALLEDARAGRLRLSRKYPLYHGGYRLWEVAESMRVADQTLFLNQYDLHYAVDRLGVDPASANVLPNGLPDELLGLPFHELPEDGPIKIAMLGTFIDRKGIAYACPALSAVLRQEPRAQVSLLGTYVSADKVLPRFDSDVRQRVEVIPRYARHDLPSLLADHGIILFASLFEGFGKSALEGMACGLVPVSTDVPGPSDFVHHEANGLLVPPRDARALEEAMLRLVRDRDLMDKLRRAAHRDAQAYSWKSIARGTLDVYETALQRARERRARLRHR